jgi:uncharacterized coiled-coil protein SlyX
MAMSGEPENLILVYLRRIDEKLDRVIADVGDLKTRLTAVEERVARLDWRFADSEVAIAGVNRRLDRVEARLDRIEKRLDLVEMPH